jgi:hypothetical protein
MVLKYLKGRHNMIGDHVRDLVDTSSVVSLIQLSFFLVLQAFEVSASNILGVYR